MRPTQKMYNIAIQSADNWRKNYDAVNQDANYWFQKFNQAFRSHVYFFMAGIMSGVLGTLLVATIFNVT